MRIKPAVFARGLLIVTALAGGAGATPTVTITLAPAIHSEDVHISYVLYGSFGSAGGNVTPRANVHSYQIKPVQDGSMAAEIRAVIYATGCEFDTLEAEISGDTAIEKSYDCIELPTVTLVGHIVRGRPFHNGNLEVVVRYEAEWECAFFGFFDCMVPQIELARAPVNENGEFEATFADFSPEQSSPLCNKAELWVVLRDAKTWNWIGTGLSPAKEFQAESVTALTIRPFYPPPVEFEVVLPSSTPRAPSSAK